MNIYVEYVLLIVMSVYLLYLSRNFNRRKYKTNLVAATVVLCKIIYIANIRLRQSDKYCDVA